MRGIVIDNDRTGVLINTLSQLPNCFVFVKFEKDLVIGTGVTDELNDLKSKTRQRSSSTTSGDENEPSENSKIANDLQRGFPGHKS